jgi:aminopeptidase
MVHGRQQDLTSLLETYARLVVEFAAGVSDGDEVFVWASVEQAPFVRRLAERCYRAGARFVDVLYVDGHVEAALAAFAQDERALEWSPPWQVERLEWMAQRGGVNIGLTAGPRPSPFDEPSRPVLPRELLAAYRRLLKEGRFRRTTAPAATPTWAEQLYGEPDLDRLWRELLAACRFDEPDPLAAWDARVEELAERAVLLTERAFDALEFRGPGTDLVVGLVPPAQWRAVRSVDADGRRFVGNIPTEEVGTAPHRLRADGRVRATRPVVVAGELVEGLELELAGGAVVEARATRGEEAVRRQLALDEGARRLGEVALVDSSSRIAALGLTFRNTVLDENAVSHIAWGQAALDVVPAEVAADEAGRREAGLNDSEVHTDVGIGGDEVDVHGLKAGGARVPILVAGQWRLSA